MEDVARLAGTSVITVSRVLNGHPRVSPATRRRVLEAVSAVGYRPNGLARGLVTRKSRLVGAVVSDITNPVFAQMIRGIADGLRARGYGLLLAHTDGDPQRDAEAVEMMLATGIDGLILCSTRAPEPVLQMAPEVGKAVVLVNRHVSHPNIHCVVADNQGGSKEAVLHLLRLGHRRIAYISGPPASWSNQQRLIGYRSALEQGGIPYDPDLVPVAVPPNVTGGDVAMQQLLALPEPPTAVLAFDDLVAIGVIRSAARQGRQVPSDIAVVGFDDIELAEYLWPPLTTVRQPKYELGREAARLLLEAIAGNTTGQVTRVLPCELMVRHSCGARARV